MSDPYLHREKSEGQTVSAKDTMSQATTRGGSLPSIASCRPRDEQEAYRNNERSYNKQ